MESGLYVVATPIGNLADMSPRAVQVLRDADLIAAEDTRHSLRLLQHFGITTRLNAYHDHSDARTLDKIGQCLSGGGVVALISDAGTPLISDPGYRLVRFAHEQAYTVRSVPGPCAAIAALSVSGLATDRFLFEGFLPAKAGARENRLADLKSEPATLIFYEAPHRILESLASLVKVFGGSREAMLAREITKAFETVKSGTLEQLAAFVAGDSNQQRGEIVLVVAGRRHVEGRLDEQTASLLRRLAEELPAKRAAAVVAEHTGLRKNALYQFLLDEKE
ncbi:MAG: 16S rRNA (cytidine(1402)-2'-O)-methyltransferase [Halioglobus sp.]